MWSVGCKFMVVVKFSKQFPGVYVIDEIKNCRVYFFVGGWRTWVNIDMIARPTKLHLALK